MQAIEATAAFDEKSDLKIDIPLVVLLAATPLHGVVTCDRSVGLDEEGKYIHHPCSNKKR